MNAGEVVRAAGESAGGKQWASNGQAVGNAVKLSSNNGQTVVKHSVKPLTMIKTF